MKKIFPAVYLIALSLTGTAYSQANLIASNPVIITPSGNYEVNTDSKTEITSSSVKTSVIRSFVKNFKTNENVKWYEDNGYYLASFQLEDRPARVWFSKNGYLTSSVYYGTEKHLPTAEKNLVQSAYEDFEVLATQEVFSKNTKAWIVMLQNGRTTVKVRIINGEMDELEKFKNLK